MTQFASSIGAPMMASMMIVRFLLSKRFDLTDPRESLLDWQRSWSLGWMFSSRSSDHPMTQSRQQGPNSRRLRLKSRQHL
ncbi:MAG: hypothetical protein EBU85_01545 [Actinobacteria bacterium]|nr:hypothetical protein [Actinomycetota bacterium]